MYKRSSRLKNIIEKDRVILSEDMSYVISYDLKTLLENYFNLEGQVRVEMNMTKQGYQIVCTAKAVGIKSFLSVK